MNEDLQATTEDLMERVEQMKAKEKRFFAGLLVAIPFGVILYLVLMA
ncbi:hypothetical protein [Marinobacter lutaoensis]|nr:hypothetical protein [Marinobacter lutaoensis]